MGSIRDRIFNVNDIKTEIVDVPEWNVQVMIKGLTAGERAKVMAGAFDREGNVLLDRVYPELLIACVMDPKTQEPIFTKDDKSMVLQKSGAVVERLAQIAARMAGLGAESLKSAEKNSSGDIQN